MAYLPQKKKKESPQVASSETSSSTPQATSSVTPAATPSPETKSNTGWTNLGQYLSANKGAGASMGQKVGNKVSTTANTARRSLSDFTKAMTKKANDQRISSSGLVKKINESPTSVTKSDWDTFNSSQYKGPSSFNQGEGYKDVASASKSLSDLAGGDGHSQYQNLVSGTYKRPNYSRANKNLDAFLLGQSDATKGVRQNINTLRDSYTDDLKSSTESVNSAISDTQKNILDEKKALNDAYNAKTSSLSDSFNDSLEAARSKTAQEQARYSSALSDMEANKKAGIDFNGDGAIDEKDQSIYGELEKAGNTDWSQYINKVKQYGLSDFANDQDRKDYQALLGLKGLSDGFDWNTRGQGASSTGKASQAASFYNVLQDLKRKQDLANTSNVSNGDYSTFKGDPAYLKKAVKNDNYALLKEMGYTPEEYKLLRDYHNEVQDISKANIIGVHNQSSYGDVVSDEQRQLLGNVAKALGLNPVDLSKKQGTMQNKERTMKILENILAQTRNQPMPHEDHRSEAEKYRDSVAEAHTNPQNHIQKRFGQFGVKL